MTTRTAHTPKRRIVLCLDGTWNSTYNRKHREDGSAVVKPSNVLKLCRAVVPRDGNGVEQLVYYDIGVGSMARYPGASNRVLSLADKLAGGGWGAGFEVNVEDALNFLALNYNSGDEVYVFGFSRGAATARAITQFLDWSGGLPTKRDSFYLPHLFRSYVTSRGEADCRAVVQAIDDKPTRGGERRRPLDPFVKVDVAFLGVWDTVMALGSRFRGTGATTSEVSKTFYLREKPARCVRHARQALAIDEARYDFRPEIWTDHWEGQSLRQRWFAGVHSNVGGGYADDGLANIALRWIVKQAKEVQGLEVPGHLAIDDDFLKPYNPYPQDRLYDSRSALYRTLDFLRFRGGRGKRSLVSHPVAAGLSMDPSVIHRINADPKATQKRDPSKLRFPDLRTLYRPENVLQFLACQPDLPGYLETLGLKPEYRQLPPDVMRRIDELRPKCPKPALAGGVGAP